jgi:hypothetical protein
VSGIEPAPPEGCSWATVTTHEKSPEGTSLRVSWGRPPKEASHLEEVMPMLKLNLSQHPENAPCGAPRPLGISSGRSKSGRSA